MSFVLSKIFWFLAAPSTVLLLFLVIGGACAVLGRRRFGGWLIACATAGFVGVAATPVGDWVLRPLEDRFDRPSRLPTEIHGILVLGGTVEPGISASRGVTALNDSAERLVDFVSLARDYPNAKLVFSGGSGQLGNRNLTEAALARETLAALGVRAGSVVWEDRSRNTYENAVFSRELANPQPSEQWLLVTSARHMPRSVGVFRRIGWPVIPYPTDYLTQDRHDRVIGPGFVEGLIRLNAAVREWIGLIAYRLLDRTDTVFPAPGGSATG